MNLNCWGELFFEPDYIEAEYELWFDVDAFFGTHTKENPDTWINLYTRYYPATKEVKAIYVVDSPQIPEYYEFKLSKTEQKKFASIMNQYCKDTYGKSMYTLYRKEVA